MGEKMAEDIGIEEFTAAVKCIEDFKEKRENNPFNNNKGEGENSCNSQNKNHKKEFKNKKQNNNNGGKFKSVGKNGNNGNKNLKDMLKNFNAVGEFMKMMKES